MSHIVADTTPLYTVLHYSTILDVQARHGNPLINGQTDRTSVPFGQSHIKISQGNKMWLEWFPVVC